jgi:hypothetical protein
MIRPVLITLCLALVAGCDLDTLALPGSTPPTIAEQCVARAARALKVKKADIVVEEALSVPEGDLVTLDVPGEGRIGCNADVDGNIGELLRLPAKIEPLNQPPTPAPVTAG